MGHYQYSGVYSELRSNLVTKCFMFTIDNQFIVNKIGGIWGILALFIRG